MAQSAAKKIESEVAELESQIEAESKGRDDTLRMYKRTQVSAALCQESTSWAIKLFIVKKIVPLKPLG